MTNRPNQNYSSPLTIAAADIPALTNGMRRVWARVRISDTPFGAPRDDWERRGQLILTRMGLLGNSGMTDEGMQAFVCRVVPTLAWALAPCPESNSGWLDAVTLPMHVAPCTALPQDWFRIGLANALLSSAGVPRPSTIRRNWFEAARHWVMAGGVVDGLRVQAIHGLWPCSTLRLARAVRVVTTRSDRMAA